MSTFSGTIHTTVPRYGFWMPGCQLWACKARSEASLPHGSPLAPSPEPQTRPHLSPPYMGSDPNPHLTPLSHQASLTHCPHTQLASLPAGDLPHLGADSSVPPGPHHHQLIGLPGGGEKEVLLRPTRPASPSPLGSSFCPHPPPPGDGPGSWLSRQLVIGSHQEQGEAAQAGRGPGQRAKAPCVSAGIAKTDSKRDGDVQRDGHAQSQKDPHKPSKDFARDTDLETPRGTDSELNKPVHSQICGECTL